MYIHLFFDRQLSQRSDMSAYVTQSRGHWLVGPSPMQACHEATGLDRQGESRPSPHCCRRMGTPGNLPRWVPPLIAGV